VRLKKRNPSVPVPSPWGHCAGASDCGYSGLTWIRCLPSMLVPSVLHEWTARKLSTNYDFLSSRSGHSIVVRLWAFPGEFERVAAPLDNGPDSSRPATHENRQQPRNSPLARCPSSKPRSQIPQRTSAAVRQDPQTNTLDNREWSSIELSTRSDAQLTTTTGAKPISTPIGKGRHDAEVSTHRYAQPTATMGSGLTVSDVDLLAHQPVQHCIRQIVCLLANDSGYVVDLSMEAHSEQQLPLELDRTSLNFQYPVKVAHTRYIRNLTSAV